MIEETTANKNYPLPNPENRASQDVERIATAISMIDEDVENCDSKIKAISELAQSVVEQSIKIPDELVGIMDTQLHDVGARQYIVVNNKATGFSTVEGGGGEGGKRGEVLVKKSDMNFDTTWADPQAILKKAVQLCEVDSGLELPNNCEVILCDAVETGSEQEQRAGLTQLNVASDEVVADPSYSYILCDEIEEDVNEDTDIASRTQFGRVKIGSGIDVVGGEISAAIIANATKDKSGLVKIGSGLDVVDGTISTLEYQHADAQNYGTVKPGGDFKFGSDGTLQLATIGENIIYQPMETEPVINNVVEVISTCMKYRAFVDSDSVFSFKWTFEPTKDAAFDLELVASDNFVISFGDAVQWENPCAGVARGKTIIRFEKRIGESKLRGTLVSFPHGSAKLLTPNMGVDICEDYICGHNGCGWQACECLKIKDYSYWMSFSNPGDCIWYVDFMRSTYVEYLEYVNGYDNLVSTYFYIEGSVDGKNWKRLLTRENEKPTTYVLDEHGFFKHYRIRCGHTQIRYFRWFGYDVDDDLYELRRVVPSLPSNKASGYAITASGGGASEGDLFHVTEDAITTYAELNQRDDDGFFWIKYALPEAESVDMIDLAARRGSEANRMPTWFKIEGSNDDETWDLLLERAFLTQWYEGESRQYWINNETPYKFYRLVSIEQPASVFSISRFRLFRKIDGKASGQLLIPALTNANEGGYEIKASSDCGGGHEPVNAFDGNAETKWATSNGDAVGGWIQVKFPAETLCTKVWLRARTDNWYVQAPTSFTISASNDGVSFDVLKTVTGETWTAGEEKSFEFFLDTPKMYYRITAKSVQNREGYFALSEVNFGTSERIYKRELEIRRSIVPVMTSNEQDGVILTASYVYSGAKVYDCFEAFNGTVSDSSSWTCTENEGWIQVELPEAESTNQLKMSGGFANEEPDSFILYGSNDGENFTQILNSGALQWTHNETKKWDIECAIPYKFFRVEAKNQKTNYITISEIGLLETKTTREY